MLAATVPAGGGAAPMMLDTPAPKVLDTTADTIALSTGGGSHVSGGASISTGMSAPTGDASSSAAASAQIRLSISQADAVRMLDASRSFNEALRTIQEERNAAATNDDNSNGDGVDTVPSSASKKKKQAMSCAAAEQSQQQELQARSPSPMEAEANDEGLRTKASFSPGRTSSATSTGSAANNASKKAPLRSLLIPAAERCAADNAFIQSYLRQMKAEGVSRAEMEARLLLFLDMDKSGKLVSAFGILGGGNNASEATKDKDAMDCDGEGDDGDDGDDIVVPGPLSFDAVSTLFRCFLTSISTCIHRKEGAESGAAADDAAAKPASGTPPSKAAKSTGGASPHSAGTSVNAGGGTDYPWLMSTDTMAEIAEIAQFAADRLADHVRSSAPKAMDTEDSGSSNNDTTTTDEGGVTFEALGDWYNSGGFKLIPWIELLDLAKWDYAGRAALAAAAAAAKSSRHAQRREALAAAHAADPLMGVITEEAAPDDMMMGIGPMTPNVFLEGAGVHRPSQPSPRSARTVVSFDFTGAMPSSQPFQIRITEGNLRMLKDLVTRTGLSAMSPDDVSAILLRHAEPNQGGAGVVLRRETFVRCLTDIAPTALDPAEMGMYTNLFMNFFSCFNNSSSAQLRDGLVDAKEVAVGFSFLCAGNKSTKLATAYELLDDAKTGHLCSAGLTRYLRSYLTMLVGISLLSESAEKTAETSHMLREQTRSDMFVAVENGSQWTKDQFVLALEQRRAGGRPKTNKAMREDIMATFEDFAQWYTEGGYTVAPWLELLDLTKFLSLINTNRAPPKRPYPSPRAHQPHADIMFTFPLANHQSLVVLREDATYVKSVVAELCLSAMTPEQLWTSLYGHVKKKPLPALPESLSRKHKSGSGKASDVDQSTFVTSMDKIMKATRRKNKIKKSKSSDGISSKDTLKNFFLSFDMHQVDRVAINELMGGLILLCGGKKSMKLAFAFGLFDGRPDTTGAKPKKKGKGKKDEAPMPPKSLDGKELFLFLRSFLIVMFSCCKQSLDLSAEEVSRYIYNTAHVIAQDVMKFQWGRKKQNRVNFDEFGEWYNEGGFETAPWLELLDLNKWVYADEKATSRRSPQQRQGLQQQAQKAHGGGSVDDILAAGGADDFLDDIFGMNMDDGMDFDLFGEGETPAPVPGASGSAGGVPMDKEKENTGTSKPPPPPDNLPAPKMSGGPKSQGGGTDLPPQQQQQSKGPPPVPMPPHQRQNPMPGFPPGSIPPSNQQMMMMRPPPPPSHHIHSQSLKYNLLTGDGGYTVSISQRRVRHLRELVTGSGLCKIDGGAASSRVMEHASKPRSGPPTLSRKQFNTAMEGVLALSKTPTKPETRKELMELLSTVFTTFDVNEKDRASALEVAAGITVLCNGRKSDKLELAFDLIDVDNDGKLDHADMIMYLKSFLTVLVRVTTSPTLEDDRREPPISRMQGGAKHGDDTSSIQNVIEAGSQLAVKVATDKMKGGPIDFDKFAQYYTAGGFQSMPWLELLDLNKWLLAARR